MSHAPSLRASVPPHSAIVPALEHQQSLSLRDGGVYTGQICKLGHNRNPYNVFDPTEQAARVLRDVGLPICHVSEVSPMVYMAVRSNKLVYSLGKTCVTSSVSLSCLRFDWMPMVSAVGIVGFGFLTAWHLFVISPSSLVGTP